MFLQAGVDRIMTDLREGMDMKTYMGLYTAIHNFCTAQKAVGSGGFSANQNRGGGRLTKTRRFLHKKALVSIY